MIAPIPSSIYIQVDPTHPKQAYVPLYVTILRNLLKANTERLKI